MISVAEADRDVLRFLWINDILQEEPKAEAYPGGVLRVLEHPPLP